MDTSEPKQTLPNDRPVAPERIVRLFLTPAGELAVEVRGWEKPVADIRVRRCFPRSLQERYLCITDKDGREIVLLPTLADLDDASRRLAEAELEDKLFSPRITRLLDHKEEFGVVSITAETTRGTVTFQVRSLDDVRPVGGGRLLMRDADGNIYEIADIAAMDRRSRLWLESYA